jgi:RND superfamily putative drug exporter
MSLLKARFMGLSRSDRLKLIGFLTVVAVLSLFRIGAADRMHASDVLIPGTKSAEARALTEKAFGGEENQLMVLLKGPPAALDRQGPDVVASIARIKGYKVLDPWGAGGRGLRPKPGVAVVMVGLDRSFDEVSRFDSKRLRAQLEREVEPPVTAHLTGFAEINRAITEESIHAVEIGEVLAAPILILLLLWIFGSPIAAAMPLFLGGTVALAGAGLLDLVNRFLIPLEVTSITLGTVAALALGVDYSLLIVARFRSELAAGRSVQDASQIALVRAGRTVKFAGAVLLVAMLTAMLVAPASVLKSATVGTLVAVVLAVVGATVALPPLLRMAGHDINRFQLFTPGADSQRWGRLAKRTVRHPALAAGVVLVIIAALSIPVFNMQTGPPDPRILSDSSQARADFETVERELGGGQAVPFIVTVVANKGTLADERLAKLAAFERELRRDPRTAQVLGPATIAARAAELAEVPGKLRKAEKKARAGGRGAQRLEEGLEQAAAGAGQLVDGLAEAQRGSEQLHDGHNQIENGSVKLDAGAGTARDGTAQLRDGLTEALTGLRKFAKGSRKAGDGAGEIAEGLKDAESRIRRRDPGLADLVGNLDDAAGTLRQQRERSDRAGAQASGALQSLDQLPAGAKADPSYRTAYDQLAAALQTLTGPSDGGLSKALSRGADDATRAALAARELRTDVTTLGSRFAKLAATSTTLAARVKRMADDDGALTVRAERALADSRGLDHDLGMVATQTGELLNGVEALSTGSGGLTTTLAAGAGRAAPLTGQLERAHSSADRVRRQTSGIVRSLGRTQELGPTLKSGYATIAAIKDAPAAQRAAASWAINFDRGGSAVRLLVASRDALPTRAGNPYRTFLEAKVAKFAEQIDATAMVGGPPPQLADFDESARNAMPWLVLLIVLIAYLALVPMMRSLVLPLIAVVLNILTLLAAFGVLALCFGTNPLLGGPGFVDDIMLIVVFTVTFGLSLDYAIFILDRMREGYDRTGTVEGAISYGIDGTAGILTGAAAIMAGVFLAFAVVSPIVSLREVGVGLAVAVILDATLLRLVLLPAAVRLAGERAWREPRWLTPLSRRLKPADEPEPEPAQA